MIGAAPVGDGLFYVARLFGGICSRVWIAWNMDARLSIFGFPFGESIRCRLLLGLFVTAASSSNPTVAFTRSRKITRAAAASPANRSVTVSLSSAAANSASHAARSATVWRKFLVSVIFWFLSFVLCTLQKERWLNLSLSAALCNGYFCCRLCVQTIEPYAIRIGIVFPDVFLYVHASMPAGGYLIVYGNLYVTDFKEVFL